MDQLTAQRQRHAIADKAASEARAKFQAAANRVTQLANQLEQLQSGYERSVDSIKKQMFEAERDREMSRQEMETASKMRDDLAKVLTY